MGCLTSAESTKNEDELEKQSDQDHVDYTETYDPANMSVSRDSTMADYQFTGKRAKGSFKMHSSLNRAIKLSTIVDDSIVEMNTQNKTKQTIALPHKRVIFVSIAQLNACIDDIPSYIVSESIFCFKAKRSWFFPSDRTEHRDSRHSIRHKLSFNNSFFNILAEKDRNNLVLWMEGNKTWKDISEELINIQDIYYRESLQTYNPLKLNTLWWLNDFEKEKNTERSMYCDNADVVVEELNTSKLKFNPTMELLYQSNPSLIPMRGFDFEMYLNHHYAKQKEDNNNNNKESVTPYSPPYNIDIKSINNMETIDITDHASNSVLSNHSSNQMNLTPAPSIKLQNKSNLSHKNSQECEHDMVYIASDDEIFQDETQKTLNVSKREDSHNNALIVNC